MPFDAARHELHSLGLGFQGFGFVGLSVLELIVVVLVALWCLRCLACRFYGFRFSVSWFGVLGLMLLGI